MSFTTQARQSLLIEDIAKRLYDVYVLEQIDKDYAADLPLYEELGKPNRFYDAAARSVLPFLTPEPPKLSIVPFRREQTHAKG